MASRSSKSAKQKGGKSPSKITFAAMPGSASPPPGIAPVTLKLPAKTLEDFATQPGRWIAPGEAVTVHGMRLSGGMIYLGASMTALNGFTVEPALINPNLHVLQSGNAYGANQRRNPDYQHFSPVERWKYLKWLSTGRKNPEADPLSVYLFLYGLERRIIAPFVLGAVRSQRAEPPLRDEEMQALRVELRRLTGIYDHPSFDRCAIDLIMQLDLITVLAEPELLAGALPDPIGSLPRTGNEIPPLLAIVLARKAARNEPLTADWAWAWFRQDFEATLRTPAMRNLKEVRQLFNDRFKAIASSPALTLQLTKTPISTAYVPIGPGWSQPVSVITSADRKNLPWLRQVSREPLKLIRETAYACMDALEPYSRRVLRAPYLRDTLPVVAQLPNPLFAEHPTAIQFRSWLDARFATKASDTAIVSIADLIDQWQGAKAPATITRTEAMALLDALDKSGFVVEPDLRIGGAALAVGKEGNAVAALARRTDADLSSIATIDSALHAVGLPLLVRAARASGNADSPTLRQLALGLPQATGADSARIAARIAWLAANPKESARLPKPKDTTLAELPPGQRAQIADVLAEAAGLSGAVSPAAVAELIRLFTLLGLSDSELYSRLHATASSGAPTSSWRVTGSNLDEMLPTIRKGKASTEYAIPKPTKQPRAERKSAGVAIDHALVKKKEAESAHVSSLLADIFTEEETIVSAPTLPQPAAAPPPGSLDSRHAALLRALITKDTWNKAEVAALARAENLLPNAAIEAINEAAFERFNEPILDGDDPIYVAVDLAGELL